MCRPESAVFVTKPESWSLPDSFSACNGAGRCRRSSAAAEGDAVGGAVAASAGRPERQEAGGCRLRAGPHHPGSLRDKRGAGIRLLTMLASSKVVPHGSGLCGQHSRGRLKPAHTNFVRKLLQVNNPVRVIASAARQKTRVLTTAVPCVVEVADLA